MHPTGPTVTVTPRELSPDRALGIRVRRGEEKALGETYATWGRALYRFGLAMTGSPERAEEALQETFMQLIRKPDAYDPDRGALESFLFGVMRHMVLKQLGKERGHLALEEWDGADESTGAAPLLEGVAREERVAAVREAVLELPEHYREAVVLCDLEEMKYEDAASVLGCALGTIRSRVNRGRSLLRERLAAYRKEGGR